MKNSSHTLFKKGKQEYMDILASSNMMFNYYYLSDPRKELSIMCVKNYFKWA